MRAFPSDIVFTPAVKAVQERKGSRVRYARMERGRGWQTTVTPDRAAFLADPEREYQERTSHDEHAVDFCQCWATPPSGVEGQNRHHRDF